MNFLISLDYELFFGRRTGSVEHCLVEPSEALCKAVHPYGGKLSFFVDVGFLLRLAAEAGKSDVLRREYSELCRHLERLQQQGHELQLHIHPHWEDTHWVDGNWQIDTQRYRLHDFAEEQITEIVSRYCKALAAFCPAGSICAFRAGGWVLQPFSKLAGALAANGIEIDSTVFENGQSESDTHLFNFCGAPQKSFWRFDDDPLLEVAQGRFLEVPIAAHPVTPAFFWKLAFLRKLGRQTDKAFGDGTAIPLGRNDLLKKLLSRTWSVVSIDGRKVDFLEAAFERYARLGRNDFVVIGHPKALTRHSIRRLEQFLATRRDLRFVNYQDYRPGFGTQVRPTYLAKD
ncbi:hypothetical protein [Dechloromonas denitrificans]|uniref:hypothetical protein n=1 Tax=Dechloromonas denitrificans TaxID=281362 RepID=UPI001CF8DD5A|nr:hypothetical protein [Dechloromonas denitrificans]UCV05487.1 hypothetical protein KI611_09665 [Dechloromonas denitrificans]UCV09833.1 hypothetical protein KI615_10100 [Dechloromonas denitrificans]